MDLSPMAKGVVLPVTPKGAVLSVTPVRVKNTFIDDLAECEDYVKMAREASLRRRSLSEPPPSTSKLVGLKLSHVCIIEAGSKSSGNICCPGEETSEPDTCIPEDEISEDPCIPTKRRRRRRRARKGCRGLRDSSPSALCGPGSLTEHGADGRSQDASDEFGETPTKRVASGVEVMRLAGAAHESATGGSSQEVPWNNEWTNVFTVMMRNLPNKITKETLLAGINDAGFTNTYDFVYLPIDPNTNSNLGYSFLNFATAALAFKFKEHFEGWKFSNFESSKGVSVVPASLQGFDANYINYSRARFRQLDPAAQPLFLREAKPSKPRPRHNRKSLSLIDVAAKQQTESQQKSKEPEATDSKASALATDFNRTPEELSKGSENLKAPRFCPYCGGSEAHFKFCRFCGAAVPPVTA